MSSDYKNKIVHFMKQVNIPKKAGKSFQKMKT